MTTKPMQKNQKKQAMFQSEHPFAQYVRILGKGKTGSRNLTRQESYDAMSMILRDEVEPVQLGALMMLMRYQEENGDELAGFIDAAKVYIEIPDDMPKVDIDWSSYAGKARRLPWFILSTLLLAESGYTVLMHGSSGHTPGRIYTEEVLDLLKIEMADSLSHAGEQIKKTNFAYLPLQNFIPQLDNILNLKPLLGLRSPVNTFTRLLNPCNSDCSIQGIHHPGYRDCHQDAALLLEQPRMAVLKGDGGETEWNPDLSNLVRSVCNGKAIEEEWAPMFPKRHVNDKNLDINKIIDVWSGKLDDEYAHGAIIGTAAITLHTLGKATTHEEAISLAGQLWDKRNTKRFD
jgi:anthranilate phosphoribosyltransferase